MTDDWQDVNQGVSPQGGDWVDVPSAQPKNPDQQPGVWEGVKRGFLQRGVGAGQLLNDVGVGQKIGLPDNSAYADYAKQLEKEGKGTGISGSVGEMIGDPLTYTPLGETSAGAKGLLQLSSRLGVLGGVSGGTGASTNPDDDLEKRGADAFQASNYAALAGPVGHLLGKGVGSAAEAAANKTGLSDKISPLVDSVKNYFGGSSSQGSDVYELAQKVGFPTNGKTPEEIYSGLQDWFKKSGSDVSNQINPPPATSSKSYVRAPDSEAPSYNPNDINTAISENYHADKSDVDDLYTQTRFHGEGKTIVANDLQNQLNNAIGELSRKQFRSPSEERTLAGLQNVQQRMGQAPKPYNVGVETGETLPSVAGSNTPGMTAQVQPLNEIGYNDLVDLKQAMNEGYSDKSFSQKGDRPIASLFRNVKDSLGKAAEQDADPTTGFSPFGDSLYNADKGYADLADTYHNKSIGQYWKPEDYYDYKAGKVPDIDTQQRASKILDNIKTPTDFATIANTLPKGAVDSLRAAKVSQVIDDSGMDANSLQSNDKLIRSLIGNNPEASQAYNNLLSGVQELNKRGITDRMYDLAREQPDALPSAAKAAMYAYFAKPHYALKEAIKGLISGQGAAYQRRLTGLAGDIKSGAPSQNLLNPMTDFLSDQGGKQSAIATGDLADDTGYSVPHITIPPRQDYYQQAHAQGGRVYAPDEWLTLIRKYGKKTGVKASDRLKPDAVEKIERASRGGDNF